MGVLGLWKLIDESGKIVPLDILENKVLAVDISIWLHQVVKGFQDNKGNALANAHLIGLFNRLCKLLFYRIKPVFIFDGGVPALKRDTIAKRNQSRNKFLSESDRIQQLLLSSLAKEKIVQQALGASKCEALLSPQKSPTKKLQAIKQAEKDDIFKLPDIVEEVNESVEGATDLTESESSFDEQTETNYFRNLKSIDVNSKHFKNLPADIRLEILNEIKETRKHASWNTLHELPTESTDFCSFQMKRLLKRRQVQQSLEETEKEIGASSLSLDVIENLLIEDGLDIEKSAVGGQLASDENTRFILVRDLKKATEKIDNVEPVKLETVKEEDNQLKIDIASDPGEGTSASAEIDSVLLDEYDEDLQKAIQLSLLPHEHENEKEEHESDEVSAINKLKLSEEQKTVFNEAAKTLARGYMMEYAGLSADDFKDLLETKKNQTEESTELDQTFRYNDKYIVYGTPKANSKTKIDAKEIVSKEILSITDDDEIKSISSDADSDFIDVPDDFNTSDMNIFPIDPMIPDLPETTDLTKDFRLSDLNLNKNFKVLEVIVKPEEKLNPDEDIFADIFINTKENLKKLKSEAVVKNLQLPKNDIDDILEQLKKEKSNILKLDLKSLPNLQDQVLEDECNISKIIKSNKIDINNDLIFKLNTVSNEQNVVTTDKEEVIEDGSLGKSSLMMIENENEYCVDSDTTIIDEEYQDIENLVKNVSPKTDIILIDSQKSDEIIDILEEESESSNKVIKQTGIEMFLNIQKTPEKKAKEAEEDVPNVPSPFFTKRTPKSKTKHEGSMTNIESNKSIVKSLFPETEQTSTIATLREDLITVAADNLNQLKSKEELEDMMSELSKEQKTLESERNKQDRFGTSITDQMNRECMELLKLFGIPYIIAPMEAEAQCAFLNYVNLTDGTITDDSDIWLFGGRTVYKNFFNQKKSVLEFRMDNIEQLFNMDRKKMIQIAMLVGSDYTTGINGIGAVTALEILASFPTTVQKDGETTESMSLLSGLRKFRDWIQNGKSITSGKVALKSKLKNVELTPGFPSFNVAEAYLYPKVDDNRATFSWGYPDVDALHEFAKKNFGWTRLKTSEVLDPVLKKLADRKCQASIKNYFKLQSTPTTKTIQVSKRVRKAIDRMSANFNPDNDTTPVKQKKPRKIAVKNKIEETITISDDNMSQNNVGDDNTVTNIEEAQGSTNNNSSTTAIPKKPATRQPRKRKNIETQTSTNESNDAEIKKLENQNVFASKSSEQNSNMSKRKSPDLESVALTSKPSTSLLGKINLASGQAMGSLSLGKKTPRIPNTKFKIPQREKDEEERKSNRLKAIEIFKKSKTE